MATRGAANKSNSGQRFDPPSVLLFLLPLLWVPVSPAAHSAEVIVNHDHASTPIDRGLLRAIFTMRVRQWPDGTPIQVFVLPDSDEVSGKFCRESLGTYPYVLRAVWDRMVFTGTGLAPTVVNSEKEMRERVLSTPGAVGYVRGGTTSTVLPHFPDIHVARVSGYWHG